MTESRRGPGWSPSRGDAPRTPSRRQRGSGKRGPGSAGAGWRPAADGGRRPSDVTTQPGEPQQREMGDAIEARMNVAALRRVDPYARDIVDSSAHVALYAFGEEWAKTGIEGALFVYRRSGPPDHSLLVMNRLNTDNLIEPVTAGLELQLQEPFLLYRNAHNRIFGLWFYDGDECARIAGTIEGLARDARPDRPDAEQLKAPPPAAPPAPVDIFTMLSRAQNDYKAKAAPRAPDVASQSVMDFFAKAGGTAKARPAAAGPFGGACPRPPAADEGAPMILQRLMSNPAHSVEHIEKQQRAVTPKGDSAKKADAKRKQAKPEPAKPPSQKRPPDARPNGQSLEAELARVAVSTPKRASPLADFLNRSRQRGAAPPLAPVAPAAPEPPEDAVADVKPASASVAPDAPPKPALMPPTMFTSSASKAGGDGPAPDRPAAAPTKPTPVDVRPEPLTRNQLLQALNYLIKNDADFMTKLHEAYVKSFSELVS